ncbi:outer membrane protein [Candidatus Gastranaerophilus sp. (ex Termes propinquus)]|nr:outer membrane protein [Candidatus Gastranaerophilus sp. (ex Termes propinquus)]
MKKLTLTVSVIFALMFNLLICNSAQAGNAGYVNYSKIVESYPLAQRYKKELDDKAQSLKKYLDQQEEELKKAKDQTAQQAVRKRALAEVEKRQKDYISTKTAREGEIEKKIKDASEQVRQSKKLDIIVKEESVVSGGVDCTADVIKLLK